MTMCIQKQEGTHNKNTAILSACKQNMTIYSHFLRALLLLSAQGCGKIDAYKTVDKRKVENTMDEIRNDAEVMEEERDVVVFTDDDGNEFELDVIDYFEYEDQEYAVLMDLAGCECGEDEDGEECCGQTDVYIMKVVVNGDMEEFVAADEDKLDALSAIVEERLAGCCDDDCDCDCEDDHCDCGCSCHHED